MGCHLRGLYCIGRVNSVRGAATFEMIITFRERLLLNLSTGSNKLYCYFWEVGVSLFKLKN